MLLTFSDSGPSGLLYAVEFFSDSGLSELLHDVDFF